MRLSNEYILAYGFFCYRCMRWVIFDVPAFLLVATLPEIEPDDYGLAFDLTPSPISVGAAPGRHLRHSLGSGLQAGK